MTERQIDYRIGIGALIVEFPGVFRVGHRAPSIDARYIAAVKACGDGAVLSRLAAAHVFGLTRGKPPTPEVTAPRERRVKGVKTRRRRNIDPRDATTWRGIPITTVPRTVIDLSSLLSLDALALACHQAGVRYRTTPAQIEARMGQRESGAGKLRRVLRGDAPALLSRMERRFRKLLRGRNLTLPPITNRPVGAHYVDCRWPAHKLTVELDSYTYHASRYAWEQDRRRDREARARGDEMRRYTWTDVFEEPEPMLAEVSLLLGAG